MADNVAITAGAGTTVATDELTINAVAAQVQRVKHVLGKDGTYTADAAGRDLGGGDGAAYVDPRPLSSLIQVSSSGLTTASTNYTSGDAMGAEMQFAEAVRASGGLGRITGALLLDKAKVIGAVDLFLFDRSVTPASDNAANSWSDADMAFCVGVIEFPGPKQSANNYIGQASGLPMPYRCNATTLFGYLVTRTGNGFFSAATDLVVTLIVEAD